MTGPMVRYERSGRVGVLTLANPPLNIITAGVRDDLAHCLDQIQRDPEVRAVVLTGDGTEAFCAGADLREEEALDATTVRGWLDADRMVYDGVQKLAVPVVAAINGHCMGGGLELALACDIRVAAEDAKLRGPGVRIGLVVNTARLTWLLGPAVAKELLLTGRTFDGREAYRLGVVSSAVPRDQVVNEAMGWAQQIADRAPLAVARTKHAIERAADLAFDSALECELDHYAELVLTRDHKEALAAFFQRREPIFRAE